MPEIGLLFVTACLIGLALLARWTLASWFAPGAFFVLVWVAHVLLSFVVPEYKVWSGTIWWIYFTCFVFYLGSIIGSYIETTKITNRKPISLSKASSKIHHSSANSTLRYRDKLLSRETSVAPMPQIVLWRPDAILIICFSIGITYTILVQWMGIELSVDRAPLIFQLLLPFQFAGPLLGGMIYAAPILQGRQKWLSFLPLAPSFLLAILFSGRTAMIAPMIFWGAGYLTVDVLTTRGTISLFTIKKMGGVILLVSLLLIIGNGIYMLRLVRPHGGGLDNKIAAYQGAADNENFMQAWKKLRPAVFGQVYSFSYFFVDAWERPPKPHGGTIIFAAPLELLGFNGERYPWESIEIEYGVYSNIFTMLRPPIDDFTLWGSLVWWLIIGIAQGYAYTRVRFGDILLSPVLAWFYVDVFLVGGFFFRYNSIILSYVIVVVYLAWCMIVLRRQSKFATNVSNKNVLGTFIH